MISRRRSTVCWDHECGMRNGRFGPTVRIAMTMTGKLDGRHKHWLGRKVIGGGWMDGRCASIGLPWTDFDEQALGRCVMLFIFYRLSSPFSPTFEIFFFLFRHPRVPERSFAFVLPCHFHLPFYIQPNTNNTTLCSFNRRSFDLVSLSLSLPHIPLFARRHPPFTFSNDIVLPRSS